MAFSGEDAVAEIAALRAAVRQLIEIANIGAAPTGRGSFAKHALKRGLEQLDDVSYWGVTEGLNADFRLDAKRRYSELFSDL